MNPPVITANEVTVSDVSSLLALANQRRLQDREARDRMVRQVLVRAGKLNSTVA